MKITKSILGVSLTALALASCNDKMDYNEYTVFDQNYIERSFYYVGGFMTTIYNDIDTDWGNSAGAMLSSATDESEYSHNGNAIEDFYNGNWSASNPHQTIWTSAYEGITYCNEFLDKWTDVDFSEYSLNQDYAKEMKRYSNYQYECRWARAYFYYNLVRQYGAVPFKIHNTTGDVETALPRTSTDSIFAFINAECDSIKGKIVEDYSKLGDLAPSTGPETGRASKYSVLALKAQAALYHASPLFTQGKTDEEKLKLWQQAVEACHECIKACKDGGKDLATTYSNLWATDFYSNTDTYPEILFFRRIAAARTFEAYNFPVGYSSGQGGNCPTQDLVDAYDMIDGTEISDPASSYDPQNPYANRDPRFEMTIAHNGDVWPNDIVNTSYTALETYDGGYHSRTGGASGASYATPTSYYLKKFCNPSQILRSGYQTTSPHGWITFRLGGMYLNYAEALFQYYKALGKADAAYETDSDNKNAVYYLNELRKRAGITNYGLPTNMTNDEFWARYKKERQVELAFEGHRFYDVRRWMEDGDKFMNIHEMQITKNADGTFTYNKVAVTRGDGQWKTKWNLFPFNQTEIMKSGGAIEQNPGW